MIKSSLLLALILALLGCDAPSLRAPEPASAEPAATPSAAARAPAKAEHIAWTDTIAWRDGEAALRAAKAENKSVCVVVYADWCPRCKELAPVFATPALRSAAEGLIMVRQDQDAHAPWFEQRLGKYGDYVPRILFVDPNGDVREDLHSGHPRYPYFYAPLVADRLIANMRVASRR